MNMSQASKFLGLRTVVFHVANLDEAKAWYAKAFQVGPYFDEPFYVGFNVGGFELGLLPQETDSIDSDSNATCQLPNSNSRVTYWGVPDAAAELARLIELGAKPRSEIQDVGSGIKVADVVDPFGNVLGIIENNHFPNQAEPISNPST